MYYYMHVFSQFAITCDFECHCRLVLGFGKTVYYSGAHDSPTSVWRLSFHQLLMPRKHLQLNYNEFLIKVIS